MRAPSVYADRSAAAGSAGSFGGSFTRGRGCRRACAGGGLLAMIVLVVQVCYYLVARDYMTMDLLPSDEFLLAVGMQDASRSRSRTPHPMPNDPRIHVKQEPVKAAVGKRSARNSSTAHDAASTLSESSTVAALAAKSGEAAHSAVPTRSPRSMQVTLTVKPAGGSHEVRTENSVLMPAASSSASSKSSVARRIPKTVPPAEVFVTQPVPKCEKTKQYIFLHWAPHWGSHRIPHGHKLLKDCPYDCLEWVQTSDKTYLPRADIVAVHDWNGYPPLPARAHPDQLFMIITMESPYSSYGSQSHVHLFQLSYTYRLDSDARAAYIPIGLSSFLEISGPIPYTFSEKHAEAVSSLVSNCGGYVPRVRFMTELSQHIELHSYGGCFHNHDLPSRHDIKPLTKYKFSMVFENSLCRDYVTEKWWRALIQATIPLVTSYKGIPDYRKYAPTLHSYVNIADYPDTKAVAGRLKAIAGDEDLYDHYMAHRYMKRLDLNPLFLQNFANSTCDDFCRLSTQRMQVPAEMEKLRQRKIPKDTSCAAAGVLKG
eukprot:scpid67386/ scgid27206/ Alpha-(1,3)-fucosyltransferase; Fucosyltransferase 9; Fucosyltransferase IX; Galactoside 3-L-fucosyltransferase